ncbi:MAG: gliding motility-associated C-terminal domain-containing protein, partial [Bacteroidota bacterium]
KFIIYVDEEGDLKQFNANATDNSYTVENIQENTHYTFKIGVQWEESPDSIGFSNPINKFTQMPQSPDYIRAIYARVNGNNTDLKFEIAPDSELSTYKLLQANSPTGNYDTLQTINTSDYEIVATHENSNPDSEINYYKLVAINNCGNITTQSDIINNIRLEIENDDYNNLLSWNYHKESSLVDASYEIYRIAGNSDPEFVRSYSNHYNYSDNIESFQGDGLYGQFCYFIRATEAGASEFSQSNTACVYLEPKIFTPEAFTPNEDGKNDVFKPVFSFLPVDYQLIIYNRWSNIVFETNDPNLGWNGKESNGKQAPTGTYIYYIKIKTPGNQIVEKRGNITVFYP